MDAFVINGGRPLRGRVRIHGSKNASLPLMAAALVTDEPVVLSDVPQLADIANMGRLLESLGTCVERGEANPDSSQGTVGPLTLQSRASDKTLAHYDIVRTMRAGICVLGPLLASRGQARVSMPGGCAIGDRPIDLHLRGLRALGAEIHLEEGYINALAPGGPSGRLRGAHVFLGGPNGSTVLGTANILCAATLAEGVTVIESAACEPEIEDLADLLTQMGARISGAGGPRIQVEGVESLSGAEHTIIADRIEAGTYLCAGAITNGEITLSNFPTAALTATLDRLREVGIEIETVDGESQKMHDTAPTGRGAEDPSAPSNICQAAATFPTPPQATAYAPMRQTVRVVSQRRLSPVQVVTQPHPGFPTDLQAQIMALLALADGNSIITEKIFPQRFMHVPELLRMGANVVRTANSAIVTGVRELIGAPVMASDLRASAGLVLAGLTAHGQTTINRVYHLDRGYQRMEQTLQQLGASIERTDERAT